MSKAVLLRSIVVPTIGTEVSFDPRLVTQEEYPDGSIGTPCSKVRFIDGTWKQLSKNNAGMFVFFQNDPQASHTAFIIRSIIPSRTACYADLI